MHEDLRRRALESGKTVSRKARSKQSSTTVSRIGSENNSKSASRVVSRDASDDEGDGSEISESSDGFAGAWSTASIDGVLSATEDDDPTLNNWQEELSTRMSRILDRNRKGGSAAGREEDISFYVSVLRGRYAQSRITSQLSQLYAACLKSLKGDASERETLLALEAIGVTTITDPSTHEGLAYEACGKALQSLIHDAESLKVKREAIHTLALLTFFSSDDEAMEDSIMPLLVSIIDSDGAQVSADDSPEVVAAAIEAWSFLATLLEDAQDATSQIMDGLVDQLSSTVTAVQIAAGEAIALLYEKSYTEVESDEEPSDDEDDDSNMSAMVQRYEPFRRKDQLLSTVSSISKLSTKSRSKQDRKDLHTSFADIYQSVENPKLGPRYSSAIDMETGKYYGSRLSIMVAPRSKMIIDKWWKLIRLRALRKWLKGGFLEHHQNNEVVLEMLPVLASSS